MTETNENIIIETTETDLNKLTVNINPNIPKLMQEEFIKRVMSDVSLSEEYLTYYTADESFFTYFLEMFTDFEISYRDIDDVILTMALKDAILSSSFACNLKLYIDKQVDNRNAQMNALFSSSTATDETLETVSLLANRTLDGVNKVCDIMDNIIDLSKDGKIFRVIPKKKLDSIFEWIQKIVDGVVDSLKSK